MELDELFESLMDEEKAKAMSTEKYLYVLRRIILLTFEKVKGDHTEDWFIDTITGLQAIVSIAGELDERVFPLAQVLMGSSVLFLKGPKGLDEACKKISDVINEAVTIG